MPRRKKLTEAEKLQNKIDRHDARKLEKGLTEAPLFAEQVKEEVKAESWSLDYYRWKLRQGAAFNAEDHAISETGAHYALSRVLDTMEEEKARRLARQHMPAEIHDAMTAYRLRTYPLSVEYGLPFWMDVLSGSRRIVYAMHGEPIPGKSIRRVVEDAWWPPDGWMAPYTKDQLRELFPLNRWGRKPDPAPFDEEPFDLRQWLSANQSPETNTKAKESDPCPSN